MANRDPDPQEVATVVVDGLRFDDWEQVFVQDRWTEPFPTFRFMAAERDPIPNLWARLQFVPRQNCAIYLGGLLAVSGVITVRQTAYDANQHGVMLQGVGVTWYGARASVVHPTGNFNNKNVEQVARELISPYNLIHVIGILDPTPFKHLQHQPGDSNWQFLERIARPRGIIMGSDRYGRTLLIGEHQSRNQGQLIEGYNILRCNATMSIDALRDPYIVVAQTVANNEQYMGNTSEQQAVVAGRLGRRSPIKVPAEQPVWNYAEVMKRAQNEARWGNGDEIRVNITVQGWFAPDGDLWRAGTLVTVKSPMAMLNDFNLAIETVTYTQDNNGGTLTQLDLVAPWLLNDKQIFDARGRYATTADDVPKTATDGDFKGDILAPPTNQSDFPTYPDVLQGLDPNDPYGLRPTS